MTKINIKMQQPPTPPRIHARIHARTHASTRIINISLSDGIAHPGGPSAVPAADAEVDPMKEPPTDTSEDALAVVAKKRKRGVAKARRI